jgi:predicted AAA+ superfamily ATPase
MHFRKRHIEAILLKRMKIFPVLGVIGPRQVGKSSFLMKQWCPIHHAQYLTLDKLEVATRARRAPDQLLLSSSSDAKQHLVIDEVQKVPHLFDSIKAIVDEHPGVGKFTVTGSVNFSRKSGVRESLAGRLGLTRLFPMTLSELYDGDEDAPFIKGDFKRISKYPSSAVKVWLERGGMPLFCKFQDTAERHNAISNWLEAICYRDLYQFKDGAYDGDLAMEILKVIARNSSLVVSSFAQEHSATSKVVERHLNSLEDLLLIHRLPSVSNQRARPVFRIFDSGVISFLTRNLEEREVQHSALVSFVLNEILAQHEYDGNEKARMFHYRERGGAELDLVLETGKKMLGIECLLSADVSEYRQRGMKSFLNKYPRAQGIFIVPVTEGYKLSDRMRVVPWGCVG